MKDEYNKVKDIAHKIMTCVSDALDVFDVGNLQFHRIPGEIDAARYPDAALAYIDLQSAEYKASRIYYRMTPGFVNPRFPENSLASIVRTLLITSNHCSTTCSSEANNASAVYNNQMRKALLDCASHFSFYVDELRDIESTFPKETQDNNE